MRTAVIGAGITGLVAGFRLGEAGHEVDVYERWPGLGGQVATLDVGARVPIERYYHHLFTSDRHIADLYEELGMADAIEWLPSSVAVFTDGRCHPFTTPLDLLRFSPVPVRTRVRTGLAALRAGRLSPRDVESMTAREWVIERMGEPAWQHLWGPLLRGKFGSRAEEISAAWLVCKLGVRRSVSGTEARREVLGYPRGGWQPLLDRLADEIVARGGRVLIDRPVARVSRDADRRLAIRAGGPGSFRAGHDPQAFPMLDGRESYDAVLATVPGDVFLRLLDEPLAAELSPGYADRVRSIDYQAALCLLLELDRPFGDYYWTNVADDRIPFVGLIEQGKLVGNERYDGRHLLYVANYVPRDDPLLAQTTDELIGVYAEGLRAVNPEFGREWIRRSWVFTEPAAQPVVTVGYHERIPALETGAASLLLANTTQIYPEDRGTNYSVSLGDGAARRLAGGGSRGD